MLTNVTKHRMVHNITVIITLLVIANFVHVDITRHSPVHLSHWQSPSNWPKISSYLSTARYLIQSSFLTPKLGQIHLNLTNRYTYSTENMQLSSFFETTWNTKAWSHYGLIIESHV